MPDDILQIERIQQRSGSEGLRVRAVLYEDTRAREAETRFTRRNGHPQWHTVVPDATALALAPRAKAVVDLTGMLPSVSRSRSKVAPQIKRAHAMHRHGGELAFLRISLPTLDDMPLRAPATVARARELLQVKMKVLAPEAEAYNVVLQGGEHGGRHLHILLPLRFLVDYPKRRAQRAAAGTGGGISIGDDIHIVRVGETEQDRASVAAYMAREPDARLGLEDTNNPVYLAALEELLQHRASGEKSELSWYRMPRSWRS